MTHRLILVIAAILLTFTAACNRDPEVAKKKYLDSGNRYFNKGKYKEALIMYRNALKKDMKYGEAYYRAALANLKLLRYPDAARDLHRAVELQPNNIDAYTRLINIYLNAYLNDKRRPKVYYNELKSLQERLGKVEPNGYEMARLSGYVALMDQKVKDAINFFEKANGIKPLQSDVVLVLIQSLAADGRKDEAEKLGFDMIKKDATVGTVYDALFLEYLRTNRLDDAEKMLRLKVTNNPKVPDYHLQLAAHFYSTRRRAEMLEALDKLTGNPKDFPNGRLQAGDFFLRIREFDLALSNYEEGQKVSAKDKALFRKRIIEVKVLQGKREEATALLNDLLKDDPKDNEAIAIRASLNILSGNKDLVQNAITDLQTVVSRMPDNPVLRFNLGRAQLARGNNAAAKIQFEEAVKLRPDYLLPRIALTQMMQSTGDFGKVVQMAQEILVYDPMNMPARLLRTRALIGMGEIKQARTELDTISKQFPDLWEAKLQGGALDLAEGRFKNAEEMFRKMFDATKDQRALMGLTETYVAQQQYAEALKLLESELAKQPEKNEYRVAMGNIYARSAQYDQATAQFRKALETQPRSADIWVRLGEVQRRAGDIAGALDSFKKGKDLAPQNVVPMVQLALLLDTTGKRDEARPVYEQILKVQPDNPIALNNLAYLLAETGLDLDSALTMAQRAKQKVPQDANIADTLGWIYIKKNLSDSAIAIFTELVQKHPERATFRYHLAMALYQKGNKPAAKKECEAALRTKPAKDEEGKIRDLLAKL